MRRRISTTMKKTVKVKMNLTSTQTIKCFKIKSLIVKVIQNQVKMRMITLMMISTMISIDSYLYIYIRFLKLESNLNIKDRMNL